MFIHFQTCVDDTTRSEEEKNENIERIFPAKTKLSCWPAGEKNNDLLKSLKWKEEDKVAKWENKDFSFFIVSLLDADFIRRPEWFKSTIQSLDRFKPTTQKPECFKSTIQGLDWFKPTTQKPEWFKSSNRSFVWFNSNQPEKPILFRKAWIWLLWLRVALNCLVFLSV